jgi:hypothetical protein
MNCSNSFRFFSAIVVLAFAATAAIVGHAQNNDEGMPQGRTMSNTVTHKEPSSGNRHLTPEEMRTAKPFPMPSVKGPPVPQQTTPNPFAAPPGSSSPGLGGPPVRQ